MSFWKNLFGTTASAVSAEESGWYSATSYNNRVHQIVLMLPPTCVRESKFANLMLGPHYQVVKKNWTLDVFRLNDDPGPYLIVRADDVTSKLRGYETRVAFGFNQMKDSGIFSIHVNVDCPPKIRQEIGYKNIGFEVFIGLDTERALDLYGKFIYRPLTHICFAEHNKAAGGYFNLSTAESITGSPQGQFDLVMDVPPKCLATLKLEWKDMLSYHETVSRPNYNAAVNELWKILPPCQENCPILPST